MFSPRAYLIIKYAVRFISLIVLYLLCVLVILYWSVLLPVDNGCGVFHAYQTVITQPKNNYHFLLHVMFQKLVRGLIPSPIQ